MAGHFGAEAGYVDADCEGNHQNPSCRRSGPYVYSGLPMQFCSGVESFQLFDRRQHQFGVDGMGDILRLDRRIYRDAGHVVGLQRAGGMGHSQALRQQRLQLVADPLVLVAQPGALMREGVGEKLFAGEVLWSRKRVRASPRRRRTQLVTKRLVGINS